MRTKILVTAFAVLLATSPAWCQEIQPSAVRNSGGKSLGRWSDRTLVVGLSVDRDAATLVSYTVKCRPFERSLAAPEVPPYEGGQAVALEVLLHGPGGLRFTQRVAVPGLCLNHPPDQAAHVLGDTTAVHHDGVLVELPEIEGFDSVEVGYYRQDRGVPYRILLGVQTLEPEKFTPAGEAVRYEDLAFARPFASGESLPQTMGTVHWPEEYGDPDIYTVYGDATEVSRRVNIVLVPDGYTYAQKATMQAHAQALVNYFRGKTPFAEHDPFVNYILVYAYSTDSGTDQCDCGILLNTPMNTGFPKDVPTCGSSDNRCLYYGYSCGGDTSTTNIVSAEQRAPAKDVTLIMVNTTRYGGCGGSRAVYSAGNSSATEVGIHELGHSLAGLADEYAYESCCATYGAGEVNTSLNATNGAWPEWIADTGAPRVGADYCQSCVYRPETSCDMQALGYPFCRVCAQRWALTFFGHSRVSPTAPISSSSPASPVAVTTCPSTDFSVTTRLAKGSSVTNSMTWQIQGPGYPTPTTVATGVTSYARSFGTTGTYTLTCEVIADTNFVKPSKAGANRDVATWTVNVSPQATITGGSANVCPSATVLLTTESGQNSYQWNLNGSPIAGANSDQYTATASGSYTVSYVTGGGCAATSAAKTVTLTSCLPNIVYSASGSWAQVYGNGDSVVDPGETWDVSVTLRNTGTYAATGVQASLAAAGTTFCTGISAYGAIAAGGTASRSFRFVVGPSFACGTNLSFNLVNKTSLEGPYPDENGAFTRQVGTLTTGTPEVASTADFTATKLATSTKTLAPSTLTPGATCSGAVAAFTAATQYAMVTSALLRHVSSGATVSLTRPAANGQPASTDVTSFYQAHGTGSYRMEWVIGKQNVNLAAISLTVTPLSVPACNTWSGPNCLSGTAPKPVPDGKWVTGTPLTAVKTDPAGTQVTLGWGVPCPSTSYNILYGNGSLVASMSASGAQCGIGTSGSYSWTAAPDIPGGERFIWWLVVGSDGASTEGSWGRDSSGSERNGTNASSRCGCTLKDTTGACP